MTEFEQLLQDVMPKIEKLSLLAEEKSIIDSSFYYQFDVKRGLRDINGNGVLAGLTEISDIQAFERDESGKAVFDEEGKRIPCNGILRYRGIDIKDIVRGCVQDNRYGYEEVAYLLLFGELPNHKKLKSFKNLLGGFRTLPVSFVRDVIMKAPSTDMMNGLARSVLTMYSYDDNPDDISISNVLRQCLQLISQMPLMAVYTYQVYKYYHEYNSLIIHKPRNDLSTAEAMLALMRDDEKFTELEARTLDLMLILHAEHGGGNNSTFTTHVVSSSGTDTYSVVAASLGSLKGPRHGGANIKVVKMFDDMKQNLKNRSDGAVRDYLKKLLNKEAFDKSGLIYGMGHAVYSLSDPRADIMRKYVERLAEEKQLHEDYELYEKIERLAPEVIGENRTVYKGVAANVDFYSGFVNSMLGIPMELFTPIFAVSRMAGWAAHRIEELSNKGKIIRPSYKGICPVGNYVPLGER
ncbi:MAG: citrate/2-methylcitrate synthase [Clostridia bacterium]|nr:citrate/2-methylcitrate synthase [Clostridia bacterium]MCI9518440.1 citrate/2-methylcitrate synthase [Clostridia bacterium]